MEISLIDTDTPQSIWYPTPPLHHPRLLPLGIEEKIQRILP